MYRTNGKRGFTLIELLVVVAIIGMLAAVILASLGSARLKARDARRLSDVAQIRKGLELYFLFNNSYPVQLSDLTTVSATSSFSKLPTDPLDGTSYVYHSYVTTDPTTFAAGSLCAAAPCVGYHLGVNLEDSNNAALRNDKDLVVTGGISGADATSCTAAAGRSCYDITNQ